MKKINFLMAIILTVSLCASSMLLAADGSWTPSGVFPTTYNWGDSANWAGGTIAGGFGSTAYFTNAIDAPSGYKAIMCGASPTIENMEFAIDGDDPTALYILADGTVTLTGSPTITVSSTANQYATYIGFAGFGGTIDGVQGFAKAGGGRLIMAQPTTISGTATIEGGEIQIAENDALQNADITVNSANGVVLYVQNGIVMNSGDITVNSPFGRIRNAGPGTFGINANIIAKGENAFEATGNGITNNLNGTIELDSLATALAGVTMGGSGALNINSNIIGTGDLHILGHTAGSLKQIININKPGTYSGGDTRLASWSASPRFELNCYNALSNSYLTIVNNVSHINNEHIVVDLNNNTQKVSSMNLEPGSNAAVTVELAASAAGRIEVANWAKAYKGKSIVNGGNHYINPYFSIEPNAELVLTNTYVNASAEFLIWGANGTLTIDNGGIARNFVTRFAQTPTVTTLNLNSGGKLETARFWTASINPATASAINFNGGVVSDGGEGEHEGSFMNWFSAAQSNIVKVGGAIVEVNNVNGRRILQPFYHDSALGGTADGGLMKIGPQTLVLAGANDYTGPTTVTNGTLVVSNTVAGSGITVKAGAKYGVPFTHSCNTAITVENDGKVDSTATATLSGAKITVQDGGSVYCGAATTFTINNNIDFQGWGHQGGGIEIFNTVANGTYNGTNTVIAAGTRVFQHGSAGSMTFNGPFAGSDEVHLIGQGGGPSDTHNFYLNAKNINSSRTTLRTFAATTTYEIGIDDCFPTDQQLELFVHNWGANYMGVIYNMNGYDQTVASLELNCGAGGDYVQIIGGASDKLAVVGNVNQVGATGEVTTCELEVGGKLAVNGTMLGMNNVTLLSGSSIGGDGTVAGTLTVPAGAAIAPGNSIGTLTAGDIDMTAGSEYDWEVGDTTIGEVDEVVCGALTLPAGANSVTVNVIKTTGTTLPTDVNPLYTATSVGGGGVAAIFIDYSSSPGITGPENPTLNGTIVEITGLVPEPGIIGLLTILGLAFLRKK